MHPESNDLIEQIIRPLEPNAELHLAARSYLLDRLHDAGGDEEDHVAEFVKTRANETPERSASPRAVTSAATQVPGVPPNKWRRWFYIAAASLIVAQVVPFVWKTYEASTAASFLGFRTVFSRSEPYQPLRVRNLPPQQKMLLLGDESLAPGDAERWRSLWRSDVDNRVFLAQYAKTYSAVRNSITPEIIETAARIDPENALYPLMQATRGWESVIKQTSPTPAEKKAGKRKEWIIKDQAGLDSRVALLQRVADMSGIRGYERVLLKSQLAVLPPPEDLPDGMGRISFKLHRSAWLDLFPVPKLLAAKASECANKGDIQGFQSAVSSWRSLCKMAAGGCETILDGLISRSIVSTPLEDFRDGARQLGLEEDARRFDELDKRFKQMRADEKSLSRAADPTVDLVERKGSVFFTMSALVVRSKVKTPPPITADDLRPGRYAEHALFGRFASLAAVVVFLLLAGVAALCRFRQSAVVRALSPSMTEFLRVSDYLWIAGLGVLIPIAWFLTIQFLTPFGVREWSLRLTAMIVPFAQVGAAVLLVVVATLVTAGWRLGVRGAVFGLRGKRQWIGWVMVAILVISIPAIGALPGWMPVQSERMLQFSLGVLLGAPVLWLGVSLLLNLVNRADQSLRRATLARLMIPAWMFATAAFACLIPVYHHSEKHWFKNDSLTGLANPEVEFSRYEAEVAKVFHKELRELMEDRF